MTEIILVFIGAGIGGVIRFIGGSWIYSYTGQNFPYATLIINVTGSFIIGLLYPILTIRFSNTTPYTSALILAGLLGGYTTFSSFSLETIHLLQQNKINAALLNIILSITLGLITTQLGIMLGRQIAILTTHN